ncbi:MAG: hypothetical protein QXL86_03565 [Candidatus Aenigmatarchaeota archaeon]
MKSLLSITIFLFLFSAFALAYSCSFRQSGCSENEVAILSLAKDGNAHAADYNFNYQYKICCPNAIYSSIKTNCEGEETEVISLYKPNNSHAAKKGYAQYKLCVKFTSYMNCILNSTCNVGECIGSLAKETNSHIGPCNYYPYQICCGNLTVTVEAGGPYVKDIVAPTILVVGEVKFAGEPASFANVTIRIYEGANLKATRNLIASSDGKYFAAFPNFDYGTYLVNVSANYTFASTYNTDTFKVIGKLSGCVPKTVSLGGTAQDYLTGEIIPSGTIKIYIKENGDEFTTNFSEGKWSIAFTTCLIPDERHLAIVQITDSTTGRISWSEVQFRA